ncbi:unnamed protein product [Cunninghamella blakesleeana]
MYGFNKINEMVYTNLMNDSSSQTWDFKHPHFKRGDFKSLAHIKRKTTKPTNASTSNTNTANTSNNDDDNQSNNNTNNDTNLNAHVNELSNQISSVVSKVSTLTDEIQTVKTLVQRQHDVIQDLIDIVCSKDEQQQTKLNTNLPYIFPQTSQQTRLDNLKQPSPVSLENLKQMRIESLEKPLSQQSSHKGVKRRLSIPIGVGTSNTSNITPLLNPLTDDECSNGNKNENSSISSLSTDHSSNQRKRRSSIPIGVGTSNTSNITPLLNPMTDEEYIRASRQTHFRSTSPPNHHHHHHHYHSDTSAPKFYK